MTGVQTCALPICRSIGAWWSGTGEGQSRYNRSIGAWWSGTGEGQSRYSRSIGAWWSGTGEALDPSRYTKSRRMESVAPTFLCIYLPDAFIQSDQIKSGVTCVALVTKELHSRPQFSTHPATLLANSMMSSFVLGPL